MKERVQQPRGCGAAVGEAFKISDSESGAYSMQDRPAIRTATRSSTFSYEVNHRPEYARHLLTGFEEGCSQAIRREDDSIELWKKS